MRVVALVSGGKDSCYSMQLCKQHGHDVVALANLLPEESAPDELDSFCFQTVGHQLVGAYAACTGLPLFRKRISGTSSVQDLGYSPTDGDEVEDLFHLLAFIKETVPGIQAVASGAIASDYQRLRVENVCSRLNLVSLAYLWHQPQRLLLRGMVESGVEAILVKVACLGLQPCKHLGRTIAAMEPTLLALADAYGCNVCGEGGEYETLTLDCSVFSRGCIEMDEYEVVHGTSDVGYLVPKVFRVVPKPGWEGAELPADVRHVPEDYVGGPRFSRCNVGPAPAPAVASGPSPAGNSIAAAADSAAASHAATAAAAASHAATAAAAAAHAATAAAAASHAATAAASHAATVAAAASAASLAAAAAAAACPVDPLLQPVMPTSFSVQVSMCTGPDYVQLVCRALRTRSALPSDVTECDTTAALNAVLSTTQQELAAQNMDLHHCLFVHLFLANMGHFQAANGVYCKHFPGRDPPSRACVQVCLPHDCPVMCEFLLARGSAPLISHAPLSSPSPVARHTRRVLHVQSISSWAPSCIGPYSQATSYRGLVYLAGVIPLDPPVMTVVPGDITAQVLRAMTSCEAVAVAQRTTVVGAALGLTVYLAGSAGGSCGGSVGASTGGGAGGAERSAGSAGGMELRALTRAAVEALLDHGLPCYPHSQHRQSTGAAPFGSGGRCHRSFTSESTGLATPRGNTTPGMFLTSSGLSAPGSRRAVMLGADGLDEEEEEERAAAAAAAGGLYGGRATVSGLPSGGPAAAAAAAVMDSYLQPPEVRSCVRPSVLYVTVPSLPRGSLVEIQPVCLDVEALAVIRKLSGHDSFAKRRNSSHHDAASLHHSHHHHQQQGHHQGHGQVHSSPGGTATGTTTWSELPPTPRGSLESNSSREGGGIVDHGSSPMQWQASSDVLGIAPPPSHMLSAAGFMSPETGSSLVGTPLAGPSMLSRQRSSGLGLLANGGGSGIFNRCNSPGLQQLQLHHPPPSSHASGHQLLSPTLQHLLHLQQSPQQLFAEAQPPPQQQQQQQQAMGGNSAPTRRPRLSSNGVVRDVAAAAAIGLASRASYSSSSGSSGPLVPRSSLDGNILSFEVSSGRGGMSSLGTATSTLPPQSQSAPVVSVSAPGAVAIAAPVAQTSGGNEAPVRTRPAAITVPAASVAATPIQASPFVGVVASAVACAAAAEVAAAAAAVLAGGGASPQPPHRSVAAALPPMRVPHVLTPPGIGHNHGHNHGHGHGSTATTPTPHTAAALPNLEVPAAPAVAAPQPGGGGSSSDVMVTTVCCYGQVLRSLFHLPPAVFAPGVTTAQLTRRFRRAAASVLAAHGMDMSCLIWVRVWYEKGSSVGLTDDEYFSPPPPPPPAAGCQLAGRVAGGSAGGGPRVQRAVDDDQEDGGDSSGGAGGGKGFKRDSGSGESSSALAAYATAALGSGAGGCSSPRPAAAVRAAAAVAGAQVAAALAAGSPGRPSSPAPNVSSPSARRSSGYQPGSPHPNGGQQHHYHTHHHTHHHHSNAQHQDTSSHHHHHHHSKDANHFHVSWVPVQRVATNASPQPAQCVAVLELLAALPAP